MCSYEMDRQQRITTTMESISSSILIRLKQQGYMPEDKPALGKVMTIMVDTIVRGLMEELT